MNKDTSHFEMLAARYPGRWKFLSYLIGLGFNIYNTYKNKMDIDVYQKLFMYLLSKDGIEAEIDVEKDMFWMDENTGMTCRVPFLINGNVIMDIYNVDIIDDSQRLRLKNMMKLTHITYGMIVNFDHDRLYTEKYVRDKETGIIDKI